MPLGFNIPGILNPQGPIAHAERLILLDATGIMLAVIAPVIVATAVFAWWFRAGNKKATYMPDWAYSGRLELLVWSIPALVVLFLGGIGWVSSHDLDPQKPLASSEPALEIQVVSLDWKWLFIYPDNEVASVNRLVLPAGVPVHFRLTSATVMNSFFIPQLGSQIYTMAGMTTQLYLQADRPGTYHGLSAQFSGDGFSDMRFSVEAVSQDAFKAWLAKARDDGPILDDAGYEALTRVSTAVAPYSYRSVAAKLFDRILDMEAQSPPPHPVGAETPPRTKS